jgi:hypothetical protein
MRRIVSTILIVALAAFVSPLPVAFAQGQSGTGVVNGVAQDAAKNPLANHTVQLRNLATGQITSVTQSAADGAFNFAGVNPGNFVIEIVGPGNAGVIATSATVSVAAGATATITVTASALSAMAAAGGATGLAGLFTGTSLIVVTAAGVAAVTVAVVATQDDASPSR